MVVPFTGIGTIGKAGHHKLPQLPPHCTILPHDCPRLEVTEVIPSLPIDKFSKSIDEVTV